MTTTAAINKATTLAKASIGRELRIEYKERTFIRGVIKECTHIAWQTKGKKQSAIFRVIMMCGKAKIVREEYVTELPNPQSTAFPTARSLNFIDTVPVTSDI